MIGHGKVLGEEMNVSREGDRIARLEDRVKILESALLRFIDEVSARQKFESECG